MVYPSVENLANLNHLAYVHICKTSILLWDGGSTTYCKENNNAMCVLRLIKDHSEHVVCCNDVLCSVLYLFSSY